MKDKTPKERIEEAIKEACSKGRFYSDDGTLLMRDIMQLIEPEPLEWIEQTDGGVVDGTTVYIIKNSGDVFTLSYPSVIRVKFGKFIQIEEEDFNNLDEARQAAQEHYENQHFNRMKGGKNV